MDYISLMTFFAGLLLGNRLALGRDRRKEFNDYCYPLYQEIEKFLSQEHGRSLPDIARIRSAVDYMHPWQRQKFLGATERLFQEMELERKYVHFDYHKQEVVVDPNYTPRKTEILKSLLPYLRRR